MDQDVSSLFHSYGQSAHGKDLWHDFLLYGKAVDTTMLAALGTLATAQTCSTEKTMDSPVHLLDYAASHPDAKVRYYKSNMILYVHSDASYLSEPKARSRVGGYLLGQPK
jgi:hypothetical protein